MKPTLAHSSTEDGGTCHGGQRSDRGTFTQEPSALVDDTFAAREGHVSPYAHLPTLTEVGFEAWLVADPTRAERVPSLADIETLFEGFVLSRSEEFHYLEVGASVVDTCEIRFSETDPQLVLGVSRPSDSDWLWERLFRLLDDYDLFMWWGDLTALVAREDVPMPPEMALTKVRISGAAELRSAVGAA